MSLASKYNPAEVEEKWYEYWMKHNLFHSEPDEREPYTIVIPPPNVTGVLHMGHMLNNTIQDILIRHARMMGKNACWVPGTDHASIATEAKVVKKLAEQGIKKNQDADLALTFTDEGWAAFTAMGLTDRELAAICIVSAVTTAQGAGDGYQGEEFAGLTVRVSPAAGDKCPRCWNHDVTIGAEGGHSELCARCAAVLGQ